MENNQALRVLVTGATGYVGGRLIPRLLEAGHTVTVLVRDAARITGRNWLDEVSVIEGDLLEGSGPWSSQLQSFDAAYYLVHSIYSGAKFGELDQTAAENFARAAASVPLVIYLGGLMPDTPNPSPHLKSRAETGEALRRHLPVTEFRAGPIIGSGSASFEMVRYLTERLPIMVAPRWISNAVQPIAVRDVLSYLVAALDKEPMGIVEIASPTHLTFREMMLGYAKARGLTRSITALPVLTPGLAARWIGLVTPISNKLAVPLIEGVVHPLLANTERAEADFPRIKPIEYQQAVELAVAKTDEDAIETRWTGALGGGSTLRLTDWRGTVCEERTIHVECSPMAAFRSFTSLGGETGWLVWNWAWKLRGWMDKLAGGPGLRRGRRHPTELLPGETVDFWRVERLDPGRELLLRAEMQLPGKAWLHFEVVPETDGCRLVQTARFLPDGATGALYWYALYPVHQFIFSDMISAIGKRAVWLESADPTPAQR